MVEEVHATSNGTSAAEAVEAWQIALRRQVGREETFTLTNVRDQPIFSEFHVTNPKSGNTSQAQQDFVWRLDRMKSAR